MRKHLMTTRARLSLFRRFATQMVAHCLLVWLVIFFIVCCSTLYAQSQTVTGRVVNEKSQPLAGASITVKETNAGTSTDAKGNFTIHASKGQNLEFSYLGRSSQEITIGATTTINVTLKEQDASNLNEVVVTGYMTQKKADLTGAVAVVTPKDLDKSHGTTNVLQSLQGVVPGLNIATDGSPAGNVSIQIRGLTSINGGGPLIVIDGGQVI